MATNLDVWLAIAGMAVITYLCRAGGYWAMGLVRITPRVERWLAAMPSAVIAAILAKALAAGGAIEAVGVVAAFVITRAISNDFAGMLAGIGAVAALRAAWV